MEKYSIELRGKTISAAARYELGRVAHLLAAREDLKVTVRDSQPNLSGLHDPHGFTAQDFKDAASLHGFRDGTGGRVWRSLARNITSWRNQKRPYYSSFAASFDRANTDNDGPTYMPRAIIQTLVDHWDGPERIHAKGISDTGINFLRGLLETYQPAPTETPGDSHA